MTLYASTLADVAVFAANEIVLRRGRCSVVRAPGARGRDRARLAAGTVPRSPTPARTSRCRPRWGEHAAMLVVPLHYIP